MSERVRGETWADSGLISVVSEPGAGAVIAVDLEYDAVAISTGSYMPIRLEIHEKGR